MGVSRRELAAGAASLAALAACSSGGTAGPPASVENASDALGDLDATGIAARIRAREITALEALDAAIARTERLNPELNFVIEKQYERARAHAAEPLSGPFAGVPTLIKDLLPWTGVPTRYGSRAFANFVPEGQPPYTDAILRAGLNPFGKSTTPEFGLTATTEPLLGGPTRNPWDPSKSCGGSSGGAAVAVASRAVPIAHASDGGGSIRIPASCNGLFGLKVSRGRSVSQGRPERGLSISVSGCVSRSVRDTAAWLSVTEASGAGAALAPVGMVTGPSQRRLRIAFSLEDALGNAPDADVRSATEGVAQLCRSLGHEVRERRMEVDGQAFVDAFVLLWAAGAAEVVASVQPRLPRGVGLDQVFEPLTLGLAEHYRAAPAGALDRAVAHLRMVEQQYAAFFVDADVVLTPVLAQTPPPIGELSPTLGMSAFDRVVRYVGYTPLQNAAGAPAMSVPLSWAANGMPIGAHFAAAQGQERRLLELAYELEQAAPWSQRKPRVNAG
jgi:amidase